MKWLKVCLWIVYGMFWIFGLPQYAPHATPIQGMEWATPFFLFLGAAITMLAFSWQDRARLALVGLIGWAAEVSGVWTGLPFGDYHYTSALGPQVLHVPLAMAAAWIVLFAYSAVLIDRAPRNVLIRATAGAALLTTADLIVDPVAIGPLGLWQWDQSGAYYGIPFINFVGWFATSLLLFLIFLYRRNEPPLRLRKATLGLTILLFFTCIATWHAMVLPAAAGLAILLGHGWLVLRTHAPVQNVNTPRRHQGLSFPPL